MTISRRRQLIDEKVCPAEDGKAGPSHVSLAFPSQGTDKGRSDHSDGERVDRTRPELIGTPQGSETEPDEEHQRRRERAGRQNEPMRSSAQARSGRIPQLGAARSDSGLVLTRWFEPASVPLAPDLG